MDDFMHRYLAAGQTSISNYLLAHYRDVGMTNEQFLVYLQVKQAVDRGDLLPSAAKLAPHVGMQESAVYQVLHEMVTAKLMSISPTTLPDGQQTDRYDFSLLFEKLSQVTDLDFQAPSGDGDEPDRSAVFNQIEAEFGRPLSQLEVQTIGQWLDTDHYVPQMILLALKEAVLSQAYSLKYMDRILLTWERKHLTTPAQVQQALDRQRKAGKAPSAQPNQVPSGTQDIPNVPIFKLTDD